MLVDPRKEVKVMTIVTMRNVLLLCALVAVLTVVVLLSVDIDVAEALIRHKTH